MKKRSFPFVSESLEKETIELGRQITIKNLYSKASGLQREADRLRHCNMGNWIALEAEANELCDKARYLETTEPYFKFQEKQRQHEIQKSSEIIEKEQRIREGAKALDEWYKKHQK